MDRNETQLAEERPPGQAGPAPERPGSVKGIWLVVATLSLFIIVPTATVIVWKLTSGGGVEQAPLVWAERQDWFMQNARPRPLEYDKFVQGETGKRYKKTNLVLEPATEEMLQRMSVLARREDFFESPEVQSQLIEATSQYPDQWYPAYLLASLARANADPDGYLELMTESFSRTSAAIVQRLVDADGNPVANYRLPPLAVGYDRVINGERNATLVLVYPGPVSDDDGYVYLPAWPTIYRLTDPSAPPGVEPPTHPKQLTLLPQPMDGPVPNWFSVPPPGIAQLPDGVVEVQPDP